MQAGREYSVFDSAEAEAFAGEFLSVLSHGAFCPMTTMDHTNRLAHDIRNNRYVARK